MAITGLKRNNLDNHSMVSELSEAFNIKAKVEKSPFQYIESSGTLVMKDHEKEHLIRQSEEKKKNDEDIENQLKLLLANR